MMYGMLKKVKDFGVILGAWRRASLKNRMAVRY